MKENTRNINRRSFVGKTGKLAAGLTLFQGSVLIDHAAITSSARFMLLPEENEPMKGPDISYADDSSSLSDLKWWEKEPLRIVELEEGL